MTQRHSGSSIAEAVLALGRRTRLPLGLVAAIVLAACLAGACLTQHVFWDDEAYTGILARNLLHQGSLTAWDGHNLFVYRHGWTLDRHLVEKENPPLQFYVTAASFAVFGETTFAGRLPFLLGGLLSLVAVYSWIRRISAGSGMPAWLPPLLLAVNVPFLLFIAQCRYYALVLLLVPCLLLCHAACTGARRGLWFIAGVAFSLTLALAHSIAAAATIAAIGVISLLPHPARRTRLAFTAATGAVAGAVILYVLIGRGVVDFWTGSRNGTGILAHSVTLMLRELRDVGVFEFFPVLPVPLLAAPFFVARLSALRPLSRAALATLLMMVVTLAVTAVASPQNLAMSPFADMRYALGVLAMGAFPTAAALFILAAWIGRPAAALAAAGVVFCNIAYIPAWPPRCTLCARVGEMLNRHPSGTDALLEAAKPVPPEALTMAVPDFETLPLLFYRPDLRYANLLDPQMDIDPAERAKLPPWVWLNSTPPDAVLIGLTDHPPTPNIRAGGRGLTRVSVGPYSWIDLTRPELTGHSVVADPANDAKYGWALYRPVE